VIYRMPHMRRIQRQSSLLSSYALPLGIQNVCLWIQMVIK
jgi:hypothetical protein